MSSELLNMESITKIYSNGYMALNNVSLEVNRSEIHALIGENGAGKTTLMKILFGLEDSQNGTVTLDGVEENIANPLDAIDKGVGMVHQHFNLVPNLSIAENVMLGIEPGKGPMFSKKEAIQQTVDACEKFNFNLDPNSLIRDISVGQKQQVELLKALVRGAKVLILDEPTAVLTPQETRVLFVQLKSLRDSGYGIIFISHKLDEVIELCDRVTVLRHGRVTGHGDISDLSAKELSRMMVEKDVSLEIDKEPAQPGEIVLKVDKLNYLNNYEKRVVNDLSFTVRAGEVVGIAGVEGNGQTELSEIITGLTKRTTGKVELNGVETEPKTIREIRDLGLAHIPEDRMIHGAADELTIRDNISSTYLDKGIFNVGPFINRKKLDAIVNQAIIEYEIDATDGADDVKLLSGGNIQKVIVARELESDANFVIANQPTRGIDVGTAELIRNLIVDATREKNTAALLISSDLAEITEMSDRLLVMKDGKICAHFHDPRSISDELLGEYMLGIKVMSNEEMGVL